jgi:hypothetical protein
MDQHERPAAAVQNKKDAFYCLDLGRLGFDAHVVGLSNVFSESEPPFGLYSSAIRAARALYPSLPIVGYDRDAGLTAALAAGFEAVHGLTVWNRNTC